MMQNVYKKGFTLIELLVVIAIIGILAGIVLASLGSARSKGSDAKYQEQLKGLQSSAEIYYSNNGSYTGLCTVGSSDTTGTYNLLLASNYGGTAPVCNPSATAWAAAHALASNSSVYFCVDSTGKATTTTTALTSGGNTYCP